MGQPVVLPKFELPGDKPHWAVRAAWIAGGLLLLSIVGLGAMIVHHRNLQTQALLAKDEARAKAKADAEAKVLAVAAAAKAAKEAEIAAKQAQLAAVAAAKAAANAPAGGAPEMGGAKVARSSHSGHRSKYSKTKGGGKVGTSVASASGGGGAIKDKSTGGTKSNKPDAIDELLKKMK
jgi:hypothetical protein